MFKITQYCAEVMAMNNAIRQGNDISGYKHSLQKCGILKSTVNIFSTLFSL